MGSGRAGGRCPGRASGRQRGERDGQGGRGAPAALPDGIHASMTAWLAFALRASRRLSANSAGLDARPEIVEGDAVEERGAVDDLAVVELHDPGVAVLVGLTVVGDPAAVPDDDDGVAVRVHPADGDRAERLSPGEPGAERS